MIRALPAVAALAWIALACRSALPPAVPLADDDPRPAALLAGLEARSASVEALRGLARLSVDGPGGSLRSKQVVVAARPARLRVEVLGFLSQTVAVLVTDGVEYTLVDTRDHSWEHDRVRPGLLYDVAGIDLDPAQAVRVLLGVPRLDGLELARASGRADGSVQLVLTDARGRPRRALEFDADGLLRRLAEWDAAGVPRFDARYADVESLEPADLARRIEIHFPATGVRATLDLSSLTLNPALSPDTFRLDPLAEPGRSG